MVDQPRGSKLPFGLLRSLRCYLWGLVVYGMFRFGSFGAFIAALRRRVLYVEPVQVPVGPVNPREHVTVKVRVRNLATGSIKLLGSGSQCGCLVADGFPVGLAPGEMKEVQIHLMALASGTSEFETAVTF